MAHVYRIIGYGKMGWKHLGSQINKKFIKEFLGSGITLEAVYTEGEGTQIRALGKALLPGMKTP